MGKKKNNKIGTVYSTNPDFEYEYENQEEDMYLAPDKQHLKVLLDAKARKGKKVTLVEGFVGGADRLKELAKLLKSKCGVGGSSKDGQIIIQGDFRDKIQQILEAEGYNCKVRR
jgi:translation initiation factor 1